MRPMITNGGPHPADKWADVTTDAIADLVQISEDSVTPEAAAARQAKRDLKPKLFAVFNAHHSGLQSGETKSPKALGAAIDIIPATTATLAKVNAVLAATPFAAHFAQPAVQAVITQIIGQHSTDVVHIERCWAADRKAA